MHLIKQVEEFFEGFDDADYQIKPFENYCKDFLKILNNLARELDNNERQKINDKIASLRTHLDELNTLNTSYRLNKYEKDKAEIKVNHERIYVIIIDVRNGDILKRYRESIPKTVTPSRPQIIPDEDSQSSGIEQQPNLLKENDWDSIETKGQKIDRNQQMKNVAKILRNENYSVDARAEIFEILFSSDTDTNVRQSRAADSTKSSANA